MAYENRTVQSSTTNTLPTGTDPLVDNTASGDVQAVKLLDGTAGSTTPILAGGGVEAGALLVTVASDSTGILSVDDNGDSLTVDAPVGTPVFVRLSDGSAAITTLPVSVATIPSHAVTNAGTFAVQVDGTALTRLTDIETNTDSGAVVGNGAAATAQRVTIANDSTGTITANTELPAAAALGDATTNPTVPGVGSFGHVWNGFDWDRTPGDASNGVVVHDATVAASLSIIDDWDETDRAKVNLIVGQAGVAAGAGAVAATVQRVTLASDDPAVTALQLIDNAISGNEMQVDIVTLPALAAGTNLIGSINVQLDASTMRDGAGTALTPKFAVIDAASSGDNTLVAAVTSKKIRVHALYLVSAGTVNVRFESGASGTALSGQMNLVANTGFVLPFNPVGWFETASNTLLNLELSGAVSVDGGLQYTEV